MSTQHTPGPWEAHEERHGIFVTEMARGSYCVAQVGKIEDARLIASAPDLLASVKQAAAMLEQPVLRNDSTTPNAAAILRGDAKGALQVLRDALAKAVQS